MACRVEANGTILDCACDGCGINYNAALKEYTAFCCGGEFKWTSKLEVDDPDEPPRPGHVVVDISGMKLLDAMRLLDSSDPRKLRIDTSFEELKRTVSLKGNAPVEELAKQLLESCGPAQYSAN